MGEMFEDCFDNLLSFGRSSEAVDCEEDGQHELLVGGHSLLGEGDAVCSWFHDLILPDVGVFPVNCGWFGLIIAK